MPASGANNRAEAIHDDLVRRVIQGEFAPGTRLPPERALAAEYDTNRNTLREALRRLEHARLVTVRQGSGVTVTDWRRVGTLGSLGLLVKHTRDPAERVGIILDLLIGRMAVLEHAVALAAEHRTDEQLARIDGVLDEQLQAYHARNKGALMRGDIALVEALVDAANSLTARWIANSFLDVYRQLAAAAQSLWIFQPEFPDYLGELSAALHARDVKAATRITRAYYAHSDETVLNVLETLVRAPAPDAPDTSTDHDH